MSSAPEGQQIVLALQERSQLISLETFAHTQIVGKGVSEESRVTVAKALEGSVNR